MKTTIRLLILFALLAAALALPGQAYAQGNAAGTGDEFVTGYFVLEDGKTVIGNIMVMGGYARLEKGSHVTGNILVMGGTLYVDGQVDGDITATGGYVGLEDDAEVGGNLSTLGATLERDPDADVNGSITTGPFGFGEVGTPDRPNVPALAVNLNPFWRVTTFLFQAFMLAAVAVLVVMFWPRHAERTAKTAVSQPLISAGLGCLTVPAAAVLVVVLSITIILIPVSVVVVALLGVMVLLGWIALGMEVGQRLAEMFKARWALPVSAGLGTLLLTVVVGGIGEFVSYGGIGSFVACFGPVLPVLVGLVGLGAVLLSRFGTQVYVAAPPAVRSPVSPAPSVVVIPPAVTEPSAPAASPFDDGWSAELEPVETKSAPAEPEPDVETEEETLASGAEVFPVDEPGSPDEP